MYGILEAYLIGADFRNASDGVITCVSSAMTASMS